MDKIHLQKKVYEVLQKLLQIGIPVSDQIEEVSVNTRAKRRLGACKRRRKASGETVYTIEISQIVLNWEENQICTVIAHELLHTCPNCFNHGREWKKMANKAGQRYGWDIKTVVDSGKLVPGESLSTEKIKYVILCDSCGAVYERKRLCPLVKDTAKYRCGKCGGILKLKGKSTTSCG